MDLSRYTYKPLTKLDEIRVLELRAIKTRIEVHILHITVSNGNFQALSYVWGQPDQASQAIVVDSLGRAVGWIPLTKNLSEAMCDLRDTEQLESKTFWIDQICIDQRDEMEKSQQVAMMRQIYTQAKRVITYLGPAGFSDTVEKRGVKLLERIRETVSDVIWVQMHRAGGLEEIRYQRLDGRMRTERLPLDLDLPVDTLHDENEISKRYVEQGWEWLLSVAYGEWTRRLWIVQEQLLNKDITTLRGHCLVDWDAIAIIPILFATGHLPRPYRDLAQEKLGYDCISWDEIELNLYGTWWERHARLGLERDHAWSSLFHNLQWYQPLLCDDPRDRVYAILAISCDAENMDLTPDYSRDNTIDALSRKLSLRVLQNTDNLDLLRSAISWRPPDSNLPSWCISLDRPSTANIVDNIGPEVYAPHPKTCGLHLTRFHNDDSILVTKGRILDYVVAPSPGIGWPCRDPIKFSLIQFSFSLIHVLPDVFTIDEVTSLLRTVTAKAPWSLPPSMEVSANEVAAFYFWAYLRHRSSLLAEFVEFSPDIANDMLERFDRIIAETRAFAPNLGHCEPQPGDALAKEESVAAKTVLQYALELGRCLGRTKEGRFYNAVSNIQAGDAIVALQGSDQLFIIRSLGGGYKLIGDVFVDGLMHGEAYKNQDPEQIDYDIELT